MRAGRARSVDRARTDLGFQRLTGAAALMAIVLQGCAGLTAPTAQADPTDDRFFAALQSRGITYRSPEAAIEAGHQVCAELGSGRTKDDVAREVMDRSGLDPYHAGYFVGASVGAYCPQFSG
jgi:hypothetical protein